MNLEKIESYNNPNSSSENQKKITISTLNFKDLKPLEVEESIDVESEHLSKRVSLEDKEEQFLNDLKLLEKLIKTISNEKTKFPIEKKEGNTTPRGTLLIQSLSNILSPRKRSTSIDEENTPQMQIQNLLNKMTNSLVNIKNMDLLDQLYDQVIILQKTTSNNTVIIIAEQLLKSILIHKTKHLYLDSWYINKDMPDNNLLFLFKGMSTEELCTVSNYFNKVSFRFTMNSSVENKAEITFKNKIDNILEKIKMLPNWISEECLASILISPLSDSIKLYDTLPYLGWIKETEFIKNSINLAIKHVEKLATEGKNINEPITSLISFLSCLIEQKPFVWNLTIEDMNYFEKIFVKIKYFNNEDSNTIAIKKIAKNLTNIFEDFYLSTPIEAQSSENLNIKPKILSIDPKLLFNFIPDLIDDFRTYFSLKLSKIDKFEFANEGWTSETLKLKTSPNIVSQLFIYDNISYNVANVIVSENTSEKMTIKIKAFTTLLGELIKYKNYPAARSIFFGLDLLPVIRNSKILTSENEFSEIFKSAGKLFNLKSAEYEKDFENSLNDFYTHKLEKSPILDLSYFLKSFTSANAKEHRIVNNETGKTLIYLDKIEKIKEKVDFFNKILEFLNESRKSENKNNLYKCEYFSDLIGSKNRKELDEFLIAIKAKARDFSNISNLQGKDEKNKKGFFSSLNSK